MTQHENTQHEPIEPAEHSQWRAQRTAQVQSAAGNLALVAFQLVDEEPEQVDGLPVTVWREPDANELRVRAQARDEVRIDGELVDGEVVWPRLRADGSGLLTWQRFTADAFSLDGRSFEVRLYDSEAENLQRFAGIDCFDHDPAMVVPARLETDGGVDEVGWQYSRPTDDGSLKRVPGTIAFELDGEQVCLTCFEDGNVLVVVFSDATTGKESHAPGRFLKIDRPSTPEFTLDLNKAFIPPCGFSDFYSCPLPPVQNRLTVPVRAGERHVLWKN